MSTNLTEAVLCPYCSEEIKKEAKKCIHCGEWLDGSKPPKELPQSERKFNWGALFLGFIWGLAHGKPITLITIPIVFIPFVGIVINFGLSIWFGIKGNEWAWESKNWESIEKFHKIQKNWVVWGFIMFIIPLLLAMTLPTLYAQNNLKVDNSKTKEAKKPKLELLKHYNCTLSSYGGNAACGIIINNTDRTMSYANVEVNLFDKNGIQIGSTMDNINNLAPNSKWEFKAPILDEDRVSNWKIADMNGF